MFPMSRLAIAVIIFLASALVFMPSDGVCGRPVAAPAGDAAIAPEKDQAKTPAKTITRKRAEPAGRVMKLDKQTAKKLNTLPKNQRIMVEGKEMTVGQYELKLEKEQKQSLRRLKAMAPSAAPSADAVQKEFEEKDAARLKAANAKVAAEMAKIGKQPGGLSPPGEAEAIRTEALAIQQRVRAGNATPADEKRAKELHDQYQALQ